MRQQVRMFELTTLAEAVKRAKTAEEICRDERRAMKSHVVLDRGGAGDQYRNWKKRSSWHSGQPEDNPEESQAMAKIPVSTGARPTTSRGRVEEQRSERPSPETKPCMA